MDIKNEYFFSGPTRDEIIRETKIKRKISSELSSAIKSLQQEHCSTGEAILR